VGLIDAVWIGGLPGLADAVGACALLALPYILLFLFGKGGAGDAKLMGAIGTWVGLADGVAVLVCVSVTGGILAVAKIVAQRPSGVVWINAIVRLYVLMRTLVSYLIYHKEDRKEQDVAGQIAAAQWLTGLSIPYGVAIFVGVCIAGGYALLCK